MGTRRVLRFLLLPSLAVALAVPSIAVGQDFDDEQQLAAQAEHAFTDPIETFERLQMMRTFGRQRAGQAIRRQRIEQAMGPASGQRAGQAIMRRRFMEGQGVPLGQQMRANPIQSRPWFDNRR